MVAGFIYFETRSTLIQRGNQHMSSVRSLATQKIKQELTYIKSQAYTEPNLLKQNSSLILNCSYQISTNPNKIGNCPDQDKIKHFKNYYFYPWEDNSFLIITKKNDIQTLWIFSHSVFDKILHQRVGLGNSGEVYLVGHDNKIKSALRFVKNWKNISFNNISVQKGKSNEQGEVITKDYRNIEVLSAFAPLDIDSLDFVIISEIDLSEILAPLHNTFYHLTFGVIFLSVFTLLLAVLATKGILRKVKLMNDEINKLYEDREEAQRLSTVKIMSIQEEEREKIAYNLHDSVGQYLTALKWGLSHLILNIKDSPLYNKAQELSDICDSIILEIRSISHDIMPSLIKDFGCFKAIEEHLNAQRKIYDLDIHYEQTFDTENLNLKKDFQINLYRMIQELLQNTIKHSDSKTITLKFSMQNEMLNLYYADDGIGMDERMGFPRSLAYRAKLFFGNMKRITEHSGLAYNIVFNLNNVKNEKN
jgi:signal transduction histidine kinase